MTHVNKISTSTSSFAQFWPNFSGKANPMVWMKLTHGRCTHRCICAMSRAVCLCLLKRTSTMATGTLLQSSKSARKLRECTPYFLFFFRLRFIYSIVVFERNLCQKNKWTQQLCTWKTPTKDQQKDFASGVMGICPQESISTLCADVCMCFMRWQYPADFLWDYLTFDFT